jgi:hypothetical protein
VRVRVGAVRLVSIRVHPLAVLGTAYVLDEQLVRRGR